MNIDDIILTTNKVICDNINEFDFSKRGLLSQNIVSQLRNFTEHISLKIYSDGKDIECNYENIVKANDYVKTRGNLRFLSKFHNLLQITASHYTLDGENSERLMLKYYEYLLKIRSYLKNTYNIDVLENISKFPLNTDSTLKDYYEKIAEKINQLKIIYSNEDRYYIQKIKPFFVDYEVYYEVTFIRANDKSSKFDRIIAFTKLDISKNYAVKLNLINETVNILGKKMPIYIINHWGVSIRPCEFNNFADIFGKHPKINGNLLEYRQLMGGLTKTGMNLTELINLSDAVYSNAKNKITSGAEVTHIFDILNKCREVVENNRPGKNIIKYLLFNLNNKVIKQQYSPDECNLLSDLHLDIRCLPFDKMPYDTSLINHNPKISDLFDCIDTTNREHELFAKFIKNNTEIRGHLYISKKEITSFEHIDKLIKTYNNALYKTHGHRKIESFNENVYIKGYEEDTVNIIRKIKDLSSAGIRNYTNSVDVWLEKDDYGMKIDCDEKKGFLKQMFENSMAALIYGSAGTGKSTIINHISNLFNNHKKLYLTNTNPANDNLKRRVNATNCTFKTITKFLSKRNFDTEFDILFIDECSTVNNSDMLQVLNKASFKVLVLVGDIFQIQSIRFGNWFDISKHFISSTAIFELTKPYRSNNSKLLELWQKVRNIDDSILEHITKNGYSTRLDDSIFDYSRDDEIILCLNYDGLYGINNINKFLQSNNKNTPIKWGVHVYKVDDPILFNESVNESQRFGPSIYNNLKGKIVKIEILTDKIQFDIEIEKTLNEFDISGYDLELIDNASNGNSIIRLFVNKYVSTDDDDNSSENTIVPFQIAYAASIHKAQGLEYKSVKIVITDEVEEMITHNIFYTAITRAKEKLKIYWSPETENNVLKKLEKRDIRKDVALLSLKYSLK